MNQVVLLRSNSLRTFKSQEKGKKSCPKYMVKPEECIFEETPDITKDEDVLFMTSERESVLYNNDESFMDRIRQMKSKNIQQ